MQEDKHYARSVEALREQVRADERAKNEEC